ncbi:hypothetical protein ES703_24148 [subsurface metagenome]
MVTKTSTKVIPFGWYFFGLNVLDFFEVIIFY